MLRRQIQLTDDADRRLRRWAKRLDISLAEAVRRCIDERLADEEAAPTREEQVRAARAVFGKYRDPKGPSRVAQDHDGHLAAAFRA